jgi:hypothetical protein
MHNIHPEPMSYKQQISLSQKQELITKLRIIRYVKRQNKTQIETARVFRCHRNTVANILKLFTSQLPQNIQQALIYNNNWQLEELVNLLSPLLNLSRKPQRHPKQASIALEEKVVDIFKKDKLKVGPKRFQTIVRRRYIDSSDFLEQKLSKIKLASLKGIFKRQKLKLKKVKSTNGQRRSLYDYQSLSCFSCRHYDVKHILEQKALPADIYQALLNNSKLPLYQWTIQDVKSRFRFLAYSRNLNAEFGLKLLSYVLCFIRFIFNNWEEEIKIGVDNGVEFCCGSEEKEAWWNQILASVKAQVYSYHPGHDIRKNLIERSHLTDDQELYIPRGRRMTRLDLFMKEVRNYMYYFNFQRPHSGIRMENRTPFEVISQSGLTNTKNLLKFPVIVLEDEIETLRQATDQLILFSEIKQYQLKNKKAIDQKKLIDLSLKYSFFKPKFAQNVLTPYLSARIKHDKKI